MPEYTYKCESCETLTTQTLSYSDSKSFQGPCKCGGLLSKSFARWGGQFVRKGYGWFDKDQQEKNYREARANRMERVMRDSHPVTKLAPNVDGVLVDNWKDAKKLSKEKGYNVDNFDAKVRNLVSDQR